MTPSAFIDFLCAQGIRLAPYPDGTLGCRAPQGVLTSELQTQIAHYKTDLLSLLRPGWPGAAGCAQVGQHNFVPQHNPLAREEMQVRCTRCNALDDAGDI